MERIPYDIFLAHTVNAVHMDHIVGSPVSLYPVPGVLRERRRTYAQRRANES